MTSIATTGETFYSRISPYYVIGIVGNKVEVQNLSQSTWTVPLDILTNESYGTVTSHTVRLPITRLVQEIFLHTKEKIFEVTFKKKDGSERALVGFRPTGSTEGNILGYSEVWELVYSNGQLKKQLRTVNHRTITKLKFAGTEYIVHRSSTNDTVHPPSTISREMLGAGQMIMRISYMRKVPSSGNSVEVENLSGTRWSISQSILDDDCNSNRTTKDPEKMRKTRLAQVLCDSGDTITETTFLKKDGTERVMVSHHTFVETCMGRSKVKELVVKNDRLLEQERQIDHQTITKIIYKGKPFVLGTPVKRPRSD